MEKPTNKIFLIFIAFLFIYSCNEKTKENSDKNNSIKEKIILDLKQRRAANENPIDIYLFIKKNLKNDKIKFSDNTKFIFSDSISSFNIGKQISRFIFCIVILNDTTQINNWIKKININLSRIGNSNKINQISNYNKDSIVRNLINSFIPFYYEEDYKMNKEIIAGINYETVLLTSSIVDMNETGYLRMLEAKLKFDKYYEQINDDYYKLHELLYDYKSKTDDNLFIDTTQMIKLIKKIRKTYPNTRLAS
ncbi:MAG TPA: hypothetical protein PK199_00935 [Bacteroidales bacterium]|nr:hypothetical protein [Bacteroidales bacterium]